MTREVLGSLHRVKKTGNGTWSACCPAHEDRTPSLTVTEGRDGLLLTCHAGCSFEDVVRTIGLEPRDLFWTNGNGHHAKAAQEVLETYPYTDEDGELLFEVVRKFPKVFHQRRPDGNGGWIWNIKGVRPVLYHLPEVLEAVALGKPIHVVEGEKDANAVRRAGGVGTCNSGGADKWRPEHTEALRGARVRVVADRDVAGRRHAKQVAEALRGVAESVEVVEPTKGKDVSDHLEAGLTLEDLAAPQEEGPDGPTERKLPAPMGVTELLAVEEPEEEWLVEGAIPAGGNFLIAGYPKTYKTLYVLDLAVSLASETPFLGRFAVPQRRRAGVVLMEDQAHRVRRRLNRLCEGKGIDLSDLAGWLYLWFRPPLRLNDQTAEELAEYAAELDLDFLGVDSWSYVASGDSNSADEVTPQLQALTHARVKRPGLTVQLTHHARKDWGKKDAGTRLTDEIRNSGAFGAWFDTGMVLSRRDENSPVTVRTELRDFPAPESFAFTVEDQEPAQPGNEWNPQGWLRLVVSKYRPEIVDRMATVEGLVPAVREFLALNPGCSKRKLRQGVKGRAQDVDGALDLLEQAGEVMILPPGGKGKPSQIILSEGGE